MLALKLHQATFVVLKAAVSSKSSKPPKLREDHFVRSCLIWLSFVPTDAALDGGQSL